jgi:hypothetical protein
LTTCAVYWATDIITQRQAQAQTIIASLESANVWNEAKVDAGGPNGVEAGAFRVLNCMTPQEFISSVVRTRVPAELAAECVQLTVSALRHDPVIEHVQAAAIIELNSEIPVAGIAINTWVRHISSRYSNVTID